MATSRLHELSEHGRERLDRLALARDARDGRARPADGGGRRRRRHVQPDDLPEGARRGRVVRRAAAGVRRGDRGPDRDLLRARAGGHPRRLRSPGAGVGADAAGSTATSRSRSTRGSPTTARRRSTQAMRFHEEVDRKNLYVKIPATQPGLGAIEDCIAKGRSINVTLIFSLAALRGGRRGVPARPGAARRRRRRPRVGASRSRASSSRASTPRPTGGSRGSAAADLQGQLAVANAKLAYEHWQEAFSGDAVGVPRRRRARGTSAACGRRRRRRTRPTATCSTSRS